MKRILIAALATVLTSVTATASAQVWLRNRSETQGSGIRSGDIEFHPGVAAEVGYDSNYFNRANNRGSLGLPKTDTVRLRVTPSFSVGTVTKDRADGSQPKVAFSGGAALIYSEFLTHTSDLSRNREFGATADLSVNVNPGRTWGFNIIDAFQRTVQPALDSDLNVRLDRNDNRAAAEIVYSKPGGMLNWRLGYAFGFTLFDKKISQDFNNLRHEVYTRGSWRFLPKTALVADVNGLFTHYTTSNPGLFDSKAVRARVGLSGLVTPRIAVLALAGWGGGFYENKKDFDSVIGQAEVRYYITDAAAAAKGGATSSVAVGFARDFANSFVGNFIERNRGYVNASLLAGKSFFMSVDGGVASVRYADVYDRRTGQVLKDSFSNMRLDASVFAEYRVKDWIGFNVSFLYLAELSDTKLGPQGAPADQLLNMQFNRYQIYGGVRAFF